MAHHRRVTARRVVVLVALVAVLAWALVPLARALLLVQRGDGARPIDLPHTEITFPAADGTVLQGSYIAASGARGTVVLVHGFKNTRADMVEYAAFLHDAHYAVFLYDSRGCGASQGSFGVGATEDRDVLGAVSLLAGGAFPAAPPLAILGVSLGAGDAILAAAHDTRVGAVVADSSWADERVQLERMSALSVGPLRVPLLPYEPMVVDALVGGRLEDARPRDVVGAIAPRPLLLIHSADDQNATTTAADTDALFAAAGEPKELWVAPRGGHAGAFAAQREEYERRVLAFLERALH